MELVPQQAEGEEKDDTEYYYGIRCWHPKWMQYLCANAKFFTFILCLTGFVEGALVSGKYNVGRQFLVLQAWFMITRVYDY